MICYGNETVLICFAELVSSHQVTHTSEVEVEDENEDEVEDS
jgi:hypothetical protein